ncbi:hypothetical protein [Humibacter sp.]|uniref:hypothetical protein n=1 Tax=Humibacter sp. TaxID=1940291 RepID=UPI002D154012|nr:hypothetical protein [Humibacter sp.]HVX08799.1 hypothetical protein [Humibacter sp.]
MKAFYLNQPHGPDQDDVPALLRRVADEIERAVGEDEEVDHVFVHRDEVNEYGSCPSAVVYFSPKLSDQDRPVRHLRPM